VEEGVERVEEAIGVRQDREALDVLMREDGDQGGVHPAGARGEGDGDPARGAAGVGFVEGECLHAVLARDALIMAAMRRRRPRPLKKTRTGHASSGGADVSA
jgi:hypothetical protein